MLPPEGGRAGTPKGRLRVAGGGLKDACSAKKDLPPHVYRPENPPMCIRTGGIFSWYFCERLFAIGDLSVDGVDGKAE